MATWDRKIPFGKPITGDEELVAMREVLESGVLAHGPVCKAFEKDFVDFTAGGRAVALASCTAALHLTYHYLGLGPGDEVIVPAMTHVATAHAVSYTGARPVFIDVERQTGNMNLDLLESVITSRTRAISIVHYLGLPLDMERLVSFAKARGLFVVEDCALAIGARYKGVHVGLWGDVGCFSFYPVKHITTAEGGMLLTRHDRVADAITKLRAFGLDKVVGERAIPGVYDVLGLGYNYRLNEIQAVLGVEQMKRLPGFLEIRRTNHLALTEALQSIEDISLLDREDNDRSSAHYAAVFVLEGSFTGHRSEVVRGLNSRGVGTSVYYPHPVPRLQYYQQLSDYKPGMFPEAERLADQSIALPVGPHVSQEDIMYMADAVRETLHEIRSQ